MFVTLDSSHGLLSVIFGFLSKFGVDIEKIKIQKNNFSVEKIHFEKINLKSFENFRFFRRFRDFTKDFPIRLIGKSLVKSKISEKIRKFRKISDLFFQNQFSP